MREPTITKAQIETRAREVIGDPLERVEIKSRIRRSERITFHITGQAAIKLTSRSYRDPDAVRKAALELFETMEQTTRDVARELTE